MASDHIQSANFQSDKLKPDNPNSDDPSADLLKDARRMVIKIGSSLLVQADGDLRHAWLSGLVEDIAEFKSAGREVLIVSSGAIALGRRSLGMAPGRLRLEDSQAAAAAGQIRLAHAYQECLGRHGVTVAQLLLTSQDTEIRRRYLNARDTIATLLARGAIPVINENDTVATEEIRFGDNDRLAARVAAMAGADCLILLSDVDGLYDADPADNSGAQRIERVQTITREIIASAGTTRSEYGQGGMATKIEAARIAMQAGCHMIIASGKIDHPLRALRRGAPCTWFDAQATPRTARKRWIAGSLKPAGKIVVDAGAAAALAAGKSLLPAGVIAVTGEFDRGEAVIVTDHLGDELARGLTAYSAQAARAIIGRKSSEIENILGYRGRVELIHRDDLVLEQF